MGPARGDLTHWRYETVDLAPQLHSGQNVLAAVVWNDGQYRAVAQITNRTGFLLQADEPENAIANTGKSWKAIENKAYRPQPLPAGQATGYYALAANERLDGRLYPWGWDLASFPDNGWTAAEELEGATRARTLGQEQRLRMRSLLTARRKTVFKRQVREIAAIPRIAS